MNITQLQYVEAVAKTENFTQAAKVCHVTQPTLSNGIIQLERELGERIFSRTTRTVSLTPFGKHILAYIEKVLRANEELTHEAKKFIFADQKTIRIGISPLINPDWLSALLNKFKEIHAGEEVILYERNMAELYRMLDENLLDFVFGVVEHGKSSWEKMPLYSEPLYFIPCGSTGLENDTSISFDKIASETFVMVPDSCGLSLATRALFRNHRRKLQEYSGEALSYQVLEQWAALGLGAAILPRSKLVHSKQQSSLLTDKKGEELHIHFKAVWLNAAITTRQLHHFASFLKEHAKETKLLNER